MNYLAHAYLSGNNKDMHELNNSFNKFNVFL